MKTFIALLFAFFIGTSLRAEIKSLITNSYTSVIEVPPGSVIEFLHAQQTFTDSASDPAEIRLEHLYVPGSGPPSFLPIKIGTFSFSTPYKGGIFAGPLRIEIDTPVTAIVSYKLTDSTSGLSASGPSNTVVIPEDASGPVAIILESSTDLINWTAALPGSYGSSTSKRFFRLRATIQ